MSSQPIPTIDISPVFGSDTDAQGDMVRQLREACKSYGFFEMTGHDVPQSLLDEALKQSKIFFDLPIESKEKYDRNLDSYNRGYERLRAQNFEKRTQGDLKEGFYFGVDLPRDHPMVVAKKFNLGPNVYPTDFDDPARWRDTMDRYFHEMRSLAEKLVRLLCKTLNVDDGWVSEFATTPIATLRLLHYPPQAPDASELERGIGAHTDFGAVTILLQDMVGGLQVWDRKRSQWADVTPTKGSLIVNLGNLMMRWTNDRYISNLHRVINKSGKERYSIPFFFAGNPDYMVECFPQSYEADKGPKYGPVSVGEWMSGRYADTYGTPSKDAKGELSQSQVDDAARNTDLMAP